LHDFTSRGLRRPSLGGELTAMVLLEYPRP